MLVDQILHGDCLDIMPTIPDGSVDMVMADLPYGVTQNQWDKVIPLDRLWHEYHRVTKPNAAIVLTATQPFAAQLIASNPRDFRYDLIGERTSPLGSSTPTECRFDSTSPSSSSIAACRSTIRRSRMGTGRSIRSRSTPATGATTGRQSNASGAAARPIAIPPR